MILVRLKGGLGNQLFQYAFGRMLSIKYSDDLVLDLSWYEGDFAQRYERTYELADFNIKAKIASSNQITAAKTDLAANRKTWLGRRIWELKKEEQFAEYNPGHLRKDARHIVLEGYWQSEKYFSPISKKIYQDISLHEGMNERGRKLIIEMNNGDNVGVHIRRGDYLNKAKEFHGVLSISYYQSAYEHLKNRFTEPNYYVFSDDPDWCKKNLDFLNPKKIISDPTRYGNWSPAQELILMSACKHNIIANSSFSWWGGWLNRYEEKVVIAPHRWFSGRTQPIDLIPNDWVLIENDFQP